jgi:hypothetical protein
MVAFGMVSVGNAAGMGWSIEPAPALPAGSGLRAVACLSRIACSAVGGAREVQWNGHAWSISATAPALAGFNSELCWSATVCMVVGWSGEYADRAFAERWNGSRWSVSTPRSSGLLTDVSCPSLRMCLAVGSHFDELSPAPRLLLVGMHVTADARRAARNARSVPTRAPGAVLKPKPADAAGCRSGHPGGLWGDTLAGRIGPMVERSDYVPPSRCGEGGRSRSSCGVLSAPIIAPVAIGAFAVTLLVHDHIHGVVGTRPRRPSGALDRVARPDVCATRCPGAPQSLDH